MTKILVSFLLIFSTIVRAYELSGTVTRVSDGDTVLVYSETKVPLRIRLLYINAPERATYYYKQSKIMLKELTLNKKLNFSCTKLDSFNRHLCVAYLDKINLNKRMVEIGGAIVFVKYCDRVCERENYYQLEKKAQKQKLGMWTEN